MQEKTIYQPGETFLHRTDPRVKLFTCVLLVAITFAAGSWLQIVMVLFFLVAALASLSPLPKLFWRVCWMLRWLLLFTLLMHLLFTEGRTLMGLAWLSLDGLYRGLLVCSQILMSLVAALLLSLTTPVAELVAAFGWSVRPLKWLGFDTDEWQKTLLLAIDYLPLVKAEMSPAKSKTDQEDVTSEATGKRLSWGALGSSLTAFVDNLLTRGDKIAHELVDANSMDKEPLRLPSLLPITLQDRLFLSACIMMVCLYGLAGG